MKKLKVSITGCLGRMGTQLIKTIKKNKQIQIVSVTEGKIGEKRKIGNLKIQKNSINALNNLGNLKYFCNYRFYNSKLHNRSFKNCQTIKKKSCNWHNRI